MQNKMKAVKMKEHIKWDLQLLHCAPAIKQLFKITSSRFDKSILKLLWQNKISCLKICRILFTWKLHVSLNLLSHHQTTGVKNLLINKEIYLRASDVASIWLKLCVLLHPHTVDSLQRSPINTASFAAEKYYSHKHHITVFTAVIMSATTDSCHIHYSAAASQTVTQSNIVVSATRLLY